MRKIFYFLLILITIVFLKSNVSFIFAQTEGQPADQPPEGEAAPPITAPITAPTNSRVSKSNTACVAVGTPAESKPAICTQPKANITAIPGAGGFVHYCQNNTPAWTPALSHCSLQSSGCGPTSLAMILSTFGAQCNGAACTPDVVDQIMKGNGQRLNDCNSAAASGVVESRWFKNLGMETAPSVLAGGFDFATAKQRINEGYLIVASASNAFSCKCNHIFVIQDVDPSARSVVVRDPVCGGGNQEVNYNEGYSNMIRSGTLNWLYAVPVRAVNRSPVQQGAE